MRQSPGARHGPDYQAPISDFPWPSFTRKNPAPNLLGNLTFGSRYGRDQRLGVLLAGSYQVQTRGSNGYFYETGITQNNDPARRTLHGQEYSTQQQRLGLNTKLDYRFDPRHTLRFYGVYLQLEEAQTRAETDTTYKGNARPDVDRLLRARYQRQGIANTTLQGEHQLTNRLSASWSLVYSRATNNVPDVSEQDLKLTASGNYYQNTSRAWLDNTDRDKAAYLNLKYLLAEGLEVAAGGLYRDKDRANHHLAYQLRADDQPDLSKIKYDNQLYYGNTSYQVAEFNAATAGSVTASQPHDTRGAAGANDPRFVAADLAAPTTTMQWTNFLKVSGGLRLTGTSPALGKGLTTFSPLSAVSGLFAPTVTPPGSDAGAYQADGTGNQQ